MVSYREYPPSELLAPYVACYWTHRCDDPDAFSNHLIVPDGTVELIISNTTIGRQYQPGGPYFPLKSHLAGLKTKPQRVRFSEPYELYGIRIRPAGLAMFTREPISETIDCAVPPEAWLGSGFLTLEKRLHSAKDDETRVLLMEQFLLGQLLEHQQQQDVILDVALETMRQSGGNARLDGIAQQLSVSCKTVERRFVRALGIPPKRYFRLYRFVNALRWYYQHPPEKLSDIAYEHGYFDQMHFVREVRAFTGCAPREYFGSWTNPASSIQAAMFRHDDASSEQLTGHKAQLLRQLFA